jgi:hypothetical protein
MAQSTLDSVVVIQTIQNLVFVAKSALQPLTVAKRLIVFLYSM